MDMNTLIYRLVEMTFFVVFIVCLRDAWRRGRHGEIPLRLQGKAKQDPPPQGRQRFDDDESRWYIQPQDEWERLPVGGDKSKRRPGYLWVCIMVAAMAFTFTFEYALTHKGEPPGTDSIYAYTVPALINLGGIEGLPGSAVPLWIPVGWALIIYLVMRTSDKLGIRWYKRPVLDGLMALMIDFALDPVAAWNHWWLWDIDGVNGLKAQLVAVSGNVDAEPTIFSGVPATNYMAWIVIVASFSFFVRLFQRWRAGMFKSVFGRLLGPLFQKLPGGFIGDALVPLLATGPAVYIVLKYTELARWVMISPKLNGALVCSAVWAACIIWVFLEAPRARRDHAHDHVLMFSPLALYGVVLLALYTTKVPSGEEAGRYLFQAVPDLVIWVPLAVILGGIVFAWPYSKPGPESWW